MVPVTDRHFTALSNAITYTTCTSLTLQWLTPVHASTHFLSAVENVLCRFNRLKRSLNKTATQDTLKFSHTAAATAAAMASAPVLPHNVASAPHHRRDSMMHFMINENKVEQTKVMCESTHEYILRPDVPVQLRLVAIVSLLLQVLVFLNIWTSLEGEECAPAIEWHVILYDHMVRDKVASLMVFCFLPARVLTGGSRGCWQLLVCYQNVKRPGSGAGLALSIWCCDAVLSAADNH
eukprot:2675-Heterococcus_DN1.PRE.1